MTVMTTARIGPAAALAALLTMGCTDQNKHAASSAAPSAPQNACMEIMSPPGQPSTKLRAVAYDTPNIDQCALYIEGLRLERGRDAWGLWNGVYIYADAKGIDAQNDLKSSRYAIYQSDTRATIDQELERQIAEKKKSSKPASSRP
jgi:hypothetical protein